MVYAVYYSQDTIYCVLYTTYYILKEEIQAHFKASSSLVADYSEEYLDTSYTFMYLVDRHIISIHMYIAYIHTKHR